jgi:succinate dehydrogenase / fumarate reductase cytochrome b subunit
MDLLKSSVGKKILMAVSGQMMLLFVIFHVIGNSTVYFGGLNAYAEQLHDMPLLVWTARLFMLTMFAFHFFFGIKLTLENRVAKPETYAVKKNLRTTFAGKSMIWTGLLIGAFLVYHLLHFTFQVTDPEISSRLMSDAAGRPDLSKMVILGFQSFFIVSIYIFALISMLLHLIHGIGSSFQTLGLNNDKTIPVTTKTMTRPYRLLQRQVR